MITILNHPTAPLLQATVGGANVTLTISYRVRFDQIDRHFAANGVAYRERITVIGRDNPPGDPNDVLFVQEFPSPGWVAGAGAQIQTRVQTITVPRAALQEDPGANNDEIFCTILVRSPNFPTVSNNTSVVPATRNTNEIVLAG